MGGYDINTILLSAVIAFMSLPKLLDALSSAGKLPRAVETWWRRRAHRLVEQEQRDSAMSALVEVSPALMKIAHNIDAILYLLRPNGGGAQSASVADRVDAIADMLSQHITEAEEDRKILAAHLADSRP